MATIKLLLLLFMGLFSKESEGQFILQTTNTVDSTWSIYRTNSPTSTYGNREEFAHQNATRFKFWKSLYIDPIKTNNDGRINTRLLWIATDGKVKASPVDSLYNIHMVPVGVPLDFAGSTPPAGYLLCDGSAVSRTTYAALFAVIGTTYGVGDGSTTFNLPDCRQAVVITKGTSGTASVLGETGGTIDHVHTVDPPNTTTSAPSATIAATNLLTTAASPTHTHDVNIAQFNSGTANQKYITFNKIIKF